MTATDQPIYQKASDVFREVSRHDSTNHAIRAAMNVIEDANADRIATLEAVIREFMRAGLGNSTDFDVQRRAYNMAIGAKAVRHA